MWARYMIAVTAGEQNADFAAPPGITFTEFDKTTGGLATPYCPRNVVANGAFKSGTEPSMPCPQHSAPMTTTFVPMYDEFGNLILTDTATMTDTTGLPPAAPPDSTLTGGVFQPQPPPPLPPPTTTTHEPLPPPEEPPPQSTDTATTTRGG
jgi:hypothetical protein